MTDKSFAKAMEYENTSVDSIKTEEESDRMSDTSSQSDYFWLLKENRQEEKKVLKD